MFDRFGWRILAGLVLLVVLAGAVGLIGWTAYNTGLAQGAAQSGAQLAPQAGGQPLPYTYAPYHFAPFGYGFGLLGCFGPLLFFFVVFALFRMIFWGGMWGHRHWGMGHHGPGGFPGFAPDDVRNRWREKAEEWHRQMHEHGGSEATPEDRA